MAIVEMLVILKKFLKDLKRCSEMSEQVRSVYNDSGLLVAGSCPM